MLQAYTDAISRAAHSAPARAAATAAGHGSSNAAAAAAAAAAAGSSGCGVLDVPAVNIITPNELAKDLFQWVHDEEVVDALYLQVCYFAVLLHALCTRHAEMGSCACTLAVRHTSIYSLFLPMQEAVKEYSAAFKTKNIEPSPCPLADKPSC